MVFVRVKDKQGAFGPFMADDPKHGCAVGFVESVAGVYLEEAKSGFHSMLFPEEPRRVNAAFDAGFEATAELVDAASFRCFVTRNGDDNLGKSAAPDLADANGTHAPVRFAKGEEAIHLPGTNGSPGNQSVGEPLTERAKGISKAFAGGAEAEEPPFEGGGVGSSEACSTMEITSHLKSIVIGDLNGDKVGESVIIRDLKSIVIGDLNGVKVGESVVVREVGCGDLGGRGMFQLEDIKDGATGEFIDVSGAKNDCLLTVGDIAYSAANFTVEHEPVVSPEALLGGGGALVFGEGRFHVSFRLLD